MIRTQIKTGQPIETSSERHNAHSKILIVGVGNLFRCDDGVGVIVTRKLLHHVPSSVDLMEMCGNGTTLMESWNRRTLVIVIDAVSSDANPGTIYKFDGVRDEIPGGLMMSTHAFGVTEAIELGKALRELPPRLIVYGIKGKNFSYGIGLSDEVLAATERVVEYVLADLELFGGDESRQAHSTHSQEEI